ncbi:hypothetical protein CLAIMM_14327 [Cladophialophora immunda]|nr:hypothetical protein CLAIMM_14327 [Cladophialophora immunda]
MSLSPRKRQITPTAEAISPQKLAIITKPESVSPLVNYITPTTLPNPLRIPGQLEMAYIDQRSCLYDTSGPNPLRLSTSEEDLQESPLLARHLLFPFDLRDNIKLMYEPENEALLCSVFPGTTGIGTDGWFMHLQLRTLPPKPWPLTIAGIPPHLGTGDTFCQGPMLGWRMVSGRNGSIDRDKDYRNMVDWEPLFQVLKRHFEDIHISITEVMYLGNHVKIVLEHRQTDMSKVPFSAGKVGCFYLYEDQMGTPSTLHTRVRSLEPTPGNPDLSQYSSLQPGLRVASAYLPGDPNTYLGTTTGILLRDGLGNEYMTVAADGFPGEAGTAVFHPSPDSSGRRIGELIMEVSHTGVALVKLDNEEAFSNVTFDSPNATVPDSIPLKRLRSINGYQQGSLIYLDSPDTGFTDGAFMFSARRRVPADENSPLREWIATTWCYMGADAAASLPAGMCGSAMWGDEGNVLGFFRYAPTQGVMKDWCTAIAADELIDRGYTLA